MSESPSYAVKVKGPGMKRWEFLTPKGTTTNLWIHACLFTKERAEYQAKFVAEHNDDTQTKVVEHFCKGRTAES